MIPIIPTILTITCSLMFSFAYSQPQPGDVFREYKWYNGYGDSGQALRVGGKQDYGGYDVKFPRSIDLVQATRAEIIVEKILCHTGTHGLSVSLNNNDWIAVPESDSIPYPQWNYQHHTYPVVKVPLAYLSSGNGNVFRLKVDTDSPDWPQNLIYGFHIRIYYDKDLKSYPHGVISSLQDGDILGDEVSLRVDVTETDTSIVQVDYIGYYEGVNWEGDGQYQQWHCHYFHGDLIHHIGSATTAPYNVIWDIGWLPDQRHPIQIAARITDDTGMIYFTDSVKNLTLGRATYSVELCKPHNVSWGWVTRRDNKSEKFNLSGDLQRAVEARMVWTSWSAGHMNGIYINDSLVFDVEGEPHRYKAHNVDISDFIHVLKQGENKLHTGVKTKDSEGEEIHGMEVQWPGIMILIKYKKSTG